MFQKESMSEDNNLINPETVNYDEGNIQTLTGLEHIYTIFG